MSDEQRDPLISLLICARLNHQSTQAKSLGEIDFLKTKNWFSLPLMATVAQGNLLKERVEFRNYERVHSWIAICTRCQAWFR